MFWILGSVFGLDTGKCYGFWEVFLDWILGSVMDSGKCFWIEYWEVLWILGSVLSLWTTVLISSISCCVPQGQLTQREASSSMSEVFEVLGLNFPHTRIYHANDTRLRRRCVFCYTENLEFIYCKLTSKIAS